MAEFDRVEKIVGKGENAGLMSAFYPFSMIFQKALIPSHEN